MTDTELDAGGVVDNTPEAWGDLLRRLADEARADAAQRDTSLVLTEQLDDLARVLDTYAVRLTGVERLPAGSVTEVLQTPVADEAQDAGSNQAETQEALDYQAPAAREELGVGAPPPAEFELPGWIRASIDDLFALSANQAARIEQLEGSLADALNRIAWLENNIGLNGVAVAPLEPSVLDTPENPDDYNPDAWGSIERARDALTRQVIRKHAQMARMRQAVLNAFVNLSKENDLGGLNDDQKSELAQHKARADRLDQIDVVRDAKLDEIGNLRDLDEARAYVADVGWPH